VARAANPGAFQTEFDECTGEMFFVNNIELKKINSSKSNTAIYPEVVKMPSMLASVSQACGILNGKLNDQAIADATAALDSIGKQVAAKSAALQPAAQKKATEAISFSSRTIRTVLDDLNAVSIAPVGVIDWAEIGPSGNGIRGSRLGPGGGVRVELASSVNFTLGYAFDIDRQLSEGRGALFFSIGIRDLFH
jgi:hypothetical protein